MSGINASILEKVGTRMEARKQGDYELADRLKEEIEAAGYFVRDFGPLHTEVGPKSTIRSFDCEKCGASVETHHTTLLTCPAGCGLEVLK